MLGTAAESTFARFFDGPACSHADLVAFATNPGHLSPSLGPRPPAAAPHPGERCPLCRFPTHTFDPDPAVFPNDLVALIQHDFPAWHPAHSLCLQCADLYRSRFLSPSFAPSGPPSC
jgi:hypothetical protein